MSDTDKEWTRVVQTARGFGKKHGHWPTRLVLPESTHDALSDTFTKDDWAFLTKEIQLRTGAERPRAEDDEGDSYIWGESLATRLTFKVDRPDPSWFNLSPGSEGTESGPDELTRALLRLGYSKEGTEPATAIEHAVARAGSAAVKQLSEGTPQGPPGTVSGELVSLLRVGRVRDLMSARAFRRIQRAVLRVYAAEFGAYFAFGSRAGDSACDAPAAWAEELSEALKQKPLPDERLRALSAAIDEQGASGAATVEVRAAIADMSDLAGWAAALALDERRLSRESESRESSRSEGAGQAINANPDPGSAAEAKSEQETESDPADRPDQEAAAQKTGPKAPANSEGP